MDGLVDAGGVRGTAEAIAEWESLVDCDPGEVRNTPPGRVGPQPCDPVDKAGRNPTKRGGTRQKRNTAASGAVLTADERRIAEFERKVIPFGKFAGKRWGDVPFSFVAWFAKFGWEKPEIKALQVAVREYLDLKYGLAPGRLF